jgi:hypothetical protein
VRPRNPASVQAGRRGWCFDLFCDGCSALADNEHLKTPENPHFLNICRILVDKRIKEDEGCSKPVVKGKIIVPNLSKLVSRRRLPSDDWDKTIIAFESPYKLRELLTPDMVQESEGIKQEQQFKIRIASSETRRNSASMLIQKMYLGRGYHSPALAEDPFRITVLISLEDRIVGTTTLGLDSPDGLLADTSYKGELDTLRNQGRHICELTKLAIDDKNADSKHMVAVLFHMCKIYGSDIHGATDFVIEINPRHATFYERMLGFRLLGPERVCPRVNAPAVLLCLPVEYANQQIIQYGGKQKDARGVKSLYPYCFSKDDEIGIAKRLQRGE